MKAKRWYVQFPQDAYALGPVEFDEEVDESEVRAYMRDWEGIKRLPAGFECWPANPAHSALLKDIV